MFHADICNDRGGRWTHGCTLQLFIEFLIEAEGAVGDSEFLKPDEFFCRDLVDVDETGAGRNFGIYYL